MLRKNRPVDFLCDPPIQVFWVIVLPLLLVYFLQILTTALTNNLYSLFGGPDIFTVIGYVGTVLSFFTSIITGISSAAWIVIACNFARRDQPSMRQSLATAICAIALVTLSGTVLLLVFATPILSFVSIPSAIYSDAKNYYILYCLSYFPTALASFFLTVLNGISSSKKLFLINMFSVYSNAAVSVLMLGLFRLGIIGAALLPLCNALARLALYILLLRKDGLFSVSGLLQTARHLQWNEVGRIVRYGSVIALQNLLCSAGYLAVSVQSNRFLRADYISVLSISLPVSNALSALSAAITAFCPQNFAAKNKQRLKQFFLLATTAGVLYALVCCAVYTLLGQWYYGRLFDDPQIIAYGAEYWFWSGISYPFLSLIFTVRFFLDSVGQSRFSLLSGIGELTGNLLCAFWLIPQHGNIGRTLSYPLGWVLGGLLLLAAYFAVRKRIYT